jgi:hypothetical protein
MQRHLDRQKQENANLQRQIRELQSQPATAYTEQSVMRLLRALHEKDPAAAMAMATELRAQANDSELQTLRNRESQRAQEAQIREVEAQNLSELRETAKALGANPDSPLIDYGDPSMFLHERMALVRSTASKAKAPAEPVTTPTRTPAQTHNAQPGVPPTPRRGTAKVTEADYAAALSAHQRKPSAATRAKMEELRNALTAQKLAELDD